MQGTFAHGVTERMIQTQIISQSQYLGVQIDLPMKFDDVPTQFQDDGQMINFLDTIFKEQISWVSLKEFLTDKVIPNTQGHLPAMHQLCKNIFLAIHECTNEAETEVSKAALNSLSLFWEQQIQNLEISTEGPWKNFKSNENSSIWISSYQLMHAKQIMTLALNPHVLVCSKSTFLGILNAEATMSEKEDPTPAELWCWFHNRFVLLFMETFNFQPSFFRHILRKIYTTAWFDVKELNYGIAFNIKAWEVEMENLCPDPTKISSLKNALAALSTGTHFTEIVDNKTSIDMMHQESKLHEYAMLVKGAMVNSSMQVVWTPANEDVFARIDDEAFMSLLWHYLKVRDIESNLVHKDITFTKSTAWLKKTLTRILCLSGHG